MRIAFLVKRFPTLSETFILNQLTGLIDAGLDVEVFASRAGTDPVNHPDITRYDLIRRTTYLQLPQPRVARIIKVVSLISSGGAWRQPTVLIRSMGVRRYGRAASTLSLLYAGASFLRSGPHDVIHCQFGYLGQKALMLRAIGALPGKLVVSFRGSDLTVGTKENAYGALFRTADRFLPVSEAFRDRLVTMGCPPEKVEVHRSGIDLRKFRCVGRTREGADPLRLLSIARLVEKKGIEYAVEAVARVAESGRAVRYDVIGDGPLRPALERKSKELGVGHLVRFLGRRDHVQVVTALGEAHALLQPSVTAGSGDQEGIPNVLKEAMATGLPVVSTRHSGIPELVEHDVSGFLVPERDVDALVDRVAHLADHPDRWPEMGRAGRKKVELEYDRDKLNRRLIELYGELMAAGAQHG